MNSSLANLLARLSGPALRLLPQSVSDQASKMFVKRLLKHLFDRLEQLFVQLCWAALTGLFQAFWLLVLQKVAGRRAAVVSAVASPSSSKRASGASTPVGAAADGVEAVEVAAAAAAAAAATPLPPSPPLAALDSERSDCASSAASLYPTTPATPRNGTHHAPSEVADRFAPSNGRVPGTESAAASMRGRGDQGKMPAALPLPGVRDGEQGESAKTPGTTMSPGGQSSPPAPALDGVSVASKASGRDTLKSIKTRLEQVRDSMAAHTRVVEGRLAGKAGAGNFRRSNKFENLKGILAEAYHSRARGRPVRGDRKSIAGVLSEEDAEVHGMHEVPKDVDTDTDPGEKKGRSAMELQR